MTLNRWDPVRDLLNFQESLNRLVHSRAERRFVRRRAHWCPIMDMAETPTMYIVKIELPGVGMQNIHIEVHGRRLRVWGERNLQPDFSFGAYHTVERQDGPFDRTVDLPGDTNPDKVEARYADGILEIYLPKAVEQRTRILTVVSLG